MKWKGFLIGLATGAAIGLLGKGYMEKKTLRSEEILHMVKNRLGELGKITGSWILAKPERRNGGKLTAPVFRGGITLIRQEKRTHIEFLADGKTGDILHLEEIRIDKEND